LQTQKKRKMTPLPSNNPTLRSWIDVSPDSDFPIQNLPFGVFKLGTDVPHIGVAIGEFVMDLTVMYNAGLLAVPGIDNACMNSGSLNALLRKGKKVWRSLREELSYILREDNDFLRNQSFLSLLLHLQSGVEMILPVNIGDYTDFYSSKEHATNVGIMFRDPANALLPNWMHMPIAYHGRASSIVSSGVPIHRPMGQTRPDELAAPVYGPTGQLDFELEIAFICGQGKPLGQPISTTEAEDYIFGFCLFNDWSARDIQKWEYMPLGPFLGKNFASSMSPWIVTMDALEPFRTASPPAEIPLLPYLHYEGKKSFDINLQIAIASDSFKEHAVSRTNYKYMYWNAAQQIAHHTINGCNLRAGDLMASGTISGPTPDSFGSMLELAWKGTKPLEMPDGTHRVFIRDDDEVILRGYARKDGVKIGFGELRNKVVG